MRRNDECVEMTNEFIYGYNLCLSLVRSPFYTIPQILDSPESRDTVIRRCADLADFDLGDLGLLEALTLGKLLSHPRTYD